MKNLVVYYTITTCSFMMVLGCYSQKKANKNLYKIQAYYPEVLAELCSSLYPPITSVKDSFYLAGSPASKALLTAFGISQGQTQVRSTYAFFRADKYAPLLELVYEDSTFSKIVIADVHEDRLKPTSIKTINKEEISIYPNPVVCNSFTVKTNAIDNSANYELYNMNGQMLQKGVLPENGKVSLKTEYPTGNYFIKLQRAKGAYGIEQLNIVK